MFITIFGTLLTISSSHWLGIWAGLEINLLGFIPLLMFQNISAEAESGVKYFIFQAVGSSFLLMGSMVKFNLTNTWELDGTERQIRIILIVLGLILKLGVFPFHYWVPPVIINLSWFSCTLLTTWQKVGPLFILSTFMQTNAHFKIFFYIFLFARLSSLISGIGGINQSKLRAIIAYSSIGHMGWLIFALTNGNSLTGFYFVVYVSISLSLFILFWIVELIDLSVSLRDSWPTSKLLKILIIIFLLSLGGIPPFLGFASKAIVIIHTIGLTNYLLVGPLILGSLLSLFYYLSLLFSILLSASSKIININNKHWPASLPIFVITLTTAILVINLSGSAIIFTMHLIIEIT